MKILWNMKLNFFISMSLIQVMSKKLPHNMENVCLSTDEEANMYAVGSKGSTDLLDARTLQVTVQMSNRSSDAHATSHRP